MSLVPLVAVVMIFGVAMLGILLAGYKEWLAYKAEHQGAAPSTRVLEDRLRALQDRVDELEAERASLQERVQNLETIVTSEAWVAQHDEAGALSPPDEALSPPDKDEQDGRLSSTESTASASNGAAQVADLARRLRTQ
jgi:flagellar motility protein MotE (MotC chaperone)